MASVIKVDTIQDSTGAFEHARLVQVVNVVDSTRATGTTAIPEDTSIPQKTEGVEVMTLAITPTHASNKLVIEAVVNMDNTNGEMYCVALFQDTTADALACSCTSSGAFNRNITLRHYMTTGTTSSTTFKIRIGGNTGATVIFNGDSSGAVYGGTLQSSITISEIRV